MVRITAQQVTDAWGRPSLLDDVFVSDLHPVRFESARRDVFEQLVTVRGELTLAELRLTDRFSLLATYLITHGHAEETRVSYGLHKNITMMRIGNVEFRARKHSIYQKAD